MEKTPMEWINKLFDCMALFYGERWTGLFKLSHSESFCKAMWQSGLTGLTYEEIKSTLGYYKWIAQHSPSVQVPNQLDFYRAAKDSHKQYIVEKPLNHPKADPEVAKQALAQIKEMLNKNSVPCRT